MVISMVYQNERHKQIVLFGVPLENSSDLIGGTNNDILQPACGPKKRKAKDYCRFGGQYQKQKADQFISRGEA